MVAPGTTTRRSMKRSTARKSQPLPLLPRDVAPRAPRHSEITAPPPRSLRANRWTRFPFEQKAMVPRYCMGVPETMNGVFCLALGISLSTAASIALGQQLGGALLAQTTGSTPPAGVLVTPLPAPVSVPPSGVLATVERGAVGARPFKVLNKRPSIGRIAPGRTRHHAVRMTHATTSQAAISGAETPLVVKSPPEQPSQVGAEPFPPFGKAKE
jgi:hypothetical protein